MDQKRHLTAVSLIRKLQIVDTAPINTPDRQLSIEQETPHAGLMIHSLSFISLTSQWVLLMSTPRGSIIIAVWHPVLDTLITKYFLENTVQLTVVGILCPPCLEWWNCDPLSGLMPLASVRRQTLQQGKHRHKCVATSSFRMTLDKFLNTDTSPYFR